MEPDRRTRRKLARCKTDAVEVDGVWWFRTWAGTWVRAEDLPPDVEDGRDLPDELV